MTQQQLDSSHSTESPDQAPWQLRMFRKTLKKRQRLRLLGELLGNLRPATRCLLVTCGDNNGAINYHLREQGGTWTWADVESTSIEEMSLLLGDDVTRVHPGALPWPDESFDLVIAIDVHEHIPDPGRFTRELARILGNEGRIVITVPGGDATRAVNRMKKWLGMTTEKYGHVIDGYSAGEVEQLMREASIRPVGRRTFSKFFTEIIELSINFAYVKFLSGRGSSSKSGATIAPQTEDQLRSVRKTYRAYSFVYPLAFLVSSLDRLLFFSEGYVVMVEGRKA